MAFRRPPGPYAAATGKITFASDRDGNPEVYLMSADGSGQTKVTNSLAADAEPGWSPAR